MRRSALDDGTLGSLASAYREKREADRAMLEQIVFYGQTGYCRWGVLLSHFGEEEGFENCGSCDNCARIAKAAAEREIRAQAVDDGLRQHKPAPPKPIFEAGSAVRVPRYGRGIVDGTDAQTVTVAFPNGSTRCFLAAYLRPGLS